MTLDLFVIKEGKNLRCGYTTGSCATAASKAAAIMLETDKVIKYVEIDTPANIKHKLEVNNPVIGRDYALCSIIKDSGDDPDNTDGIEIYSKVSKRMDGQVIIDGGIGIGRITRNGLFGEVGQAAINPVPCETIKKELGEVSSEGYNVMIYAPEGVSIGKKTFNSYIGIEGGISIIGTKGIVYPMSEDAILKTIYMEVDMLLDQYGNEHIVLVPGNYGEKVSATLGIDKPRTKISNFIGDSLLYIYNKGFKSVTLIGHIGKFSKLSIGGFNTHSKVCDGRMEAFVYYLALMNAPSELLEKINKCITAEEALNICIEAGYGDIVKHMEKGAEIRIKKYLKDEDYKVKVIIYSMKRGVDFC
ncbi:MAG: cobalamin biosynthesis protein CbiD [Tissierellia bacterium]|nr:cobalamin biosynthesis protein CbiD [Tissierellia bacterium]